MNARDELAKLIESGYGDDTTDCPYDHAPTIADAILAAGYRKPRTITTAEELDALPSGASILWGGKVYGAARVHQKGRAYWFRPGRVGHTVVTPSVVYPATVLYEPEEQS
jgi:hypothetical protein